MKSIWSLPQGDIHLYPSTARQQLPSWELECNSQGSVSISIQYLKYLPHYLDSWHCFWQFLFFYCFLYIIKQKKFWKTIFWGGLMQKPQNTHHSFSNFFWLIFMLLSSLVMLDCRSYQEVLLRKMTFVATCSLKQRESPELKILRGMESINSVTVIFAGLCVEWLDGTFGSQIPRGLSVRHQI